MIELVADNYVQSSLGMGVLSVTRLGLEYLREIEDEPLTAIDVSSNPNYDNSSLINNSNNVLMKQAEKFDLILKELYHHKNDGQYYSIAWICQSLNIPIDSTLELNKIGHRLEDDGFIKPLFTDSDCSAELTSQGIDYCEQDSYAYPGHSVITNNYSISIVNSPNTNVINQSSNVTITQNIGEVNQTIEKIREIASTDNLIGKQKATEILNYLDEIQECLITIRTEVLQSNY